MDFGGGTLPVISSPFGLTNAFVVKLSRTGAHVFSKRTGYRTVDGIAANGPRIVVSGTETLQLHFMHLQSFDASGGPGASYGSTGFGGTFAETYGTGGRVWIGPSGRVWGDLVIRWPGAEPRPYMVVLAE